MNINKIVLGIAKVMRFVLPDRWTARVLYHTPARWISGECGNINGYQCYGCTVISCPCWPSDSDDWTRDIPYIGPESFGIEE